MGIVVNLDVMMAKRKMSLGELAQKVDITMANLSILKNNKARAVRFSTLEAIWEWGSVYWFSGQAAGGSWACCLAFGACQWSCFWGQLGQSRT